MEIQLKQRIIGAVVIFTLLIIFLPMIFENDDEQKYVEQVLEPQVPKVPKLVESDGFVINQSALNQDTNNNGINNSELASKSTLDESPKNTPSDTPYINSEAIYKKFEEHKYQASKKSSDNNQVSVKTSTEKKVVAEQRLLSKNLDDGKSNAKVKPTSSELSAELPKSPKPEVTKVADRTTEVYALLLGEFSSKLEATKLKEDLLAKGYPVYISKRNSNYNVYIGPELELQYIKELSRRVSDETDYKAKIVTHSSKWLTE